MFDVANELDLDLGIGEFVIRLDHHEVRMGARLDLAAGSAGAAGIRSLSSGSGFAEERLRQAKGQEAFADAIVAMEEIGMGQPILEDRGPEQGFGAVMADDSQRRAWRACDFGVTAAGAACCGLRRGGSDRASA